MTNQRYDIEVFSEGQWKKVCWHVRFFETKAEAETVARRHTEWHSIKTRVVEV